MTVSGDVELTILDGGAGVVVTPASAVQVVIGTCSGGTANLCVASRDPNALATAVGYGPAVDQAAISMAAGATVIFVKAATTSVGAASSVTTFATGLCVVSVTGAPYDAYLVKVLVTKGGTTPVGCRIKVSLDAGRNYGPEIALTALTLALTGTGMTLAFTSATMVAGESVTFGCTEPLASVANVQAALVALEASPYSTTGWGSMRICGPRTGADASSIEGYLDTMVTTKTYPRAIIEVRDNALPVAYGGAGETDSVWSAAIATDVSAVSAKRIAMSAGNYNVNSQYPVALCGTPRMRRNGAFALAARVVTLQPQNHAGRVSDGSLSAIIVDPTNDPGDGFNYHDEHNSPSLDVARFVSYRRRKGKGGFFVVQPRLMAPAGSIFAKPQGLPLGNVMDIGCSLLNQLHDDNINSDIQLNPNGTIFEIAAQGIETVIRRGLNDNMFAKNMISGFAYAIDRTTNVRTTDTVVFSCTFFARGYILEIDGTVGFGSGV